MSRDEYFFKASSNIEVLCVHALIVSLFMKKSNSKI